VLSLNAYLVLLGVAATLSLVLLGLLIRSPLARHFADLPDHRKVHQAAIPRLGGTAIVLTFLVLLTIAQVFNLWEPSAKFLLSAVFVSLFLLIAGTLDDVLSLGYKAKFLFQFLLAGVVVCVFGLHFEAVSLFGRSFELGGLGLVLSIFWMVGLMNAVNIIDGIDGLAAGVSLVGFVGVGSLAFIAGAPNPLGVCVALSGATIGFLYYNFQRRRKVFLGDTGSQFLGAMLGVLTLRIHHLPSVEHSMLIPLLLVGYPLLDTSVAMTRRFLQVRNKHLGQRVTRMFLADNDHMHHRLLFAGLSHVQATFLLLLLASGFTAAAVVLPRMTWQWEAAVIGYLTLAVSFLLNRLGFLQSGTVRRALREWILGGVYPEGSRLASRYSRYYEIFAMTDANIGTARTDAGWPYAEEGAVPVPAAALGSPQRVSDRRPSSALAGEF
jgi:UDP-GlcNAc:undecaprenyl-phosphate GlcNAc-1-phosphate transferase